MWPCVCAAVQAGDACPLLSFPASSRAGCRRATCCWCRRAWHLGRGRKYASVCAGAGRWAVCVNRKSMTFPKIVQKCGGRKQETRSLVGRNRASHSSWVWKIPGEVEGRGRQHHQQPTRPQQSGSDSGATADIRVGAAGAPHTGRASCDAPATRCLTCEAPGNCTVGRPFRWRGLARA